MRRAVAVVALLLALGAVPAQAQERGATELELAPKLERLGIEPDPLGDASKRRGLFELPVSDGEVGTVARVEHRGGLRLSAGRHGAKLSRLGLVLAGDRSYATARLAGEQRTVLKIKIGSDAPFNPLTGEVSVERARARLTAEARALLSERLATSVPRALGTLAVHATLPTRDPDRTSPPILARPPAAVDVVSAQFTWRARESWIDYLHAAGDRGGTSVSDGAAAGPPETIAPSSQARVYQFDYPFASGWRDPQSGVAAINYGGLVNFHKLVSPFFIDLDVRDPEAEINGTESRLIFDLYGRQNSEDERRRAVAVDLETQTVTPSVTVAPSGETTHAWDRIPATVPDGSDAWQIADFYQPGDDWGWASISYTVAAQ